MDILVRLVMVSTLVSSFFGMATSLEKAIPHDKSCLVKAINSDLHIYLECKGTKKVLKTTVQHPKISKFIENLDPSQLTKQQLQLAKKTEKAKVVWALVNYSFFNQVYILISFNKNKTLIEKATLYYQDRIEKSRDDKIQL